MSIPKIRATTSKYPRSVDREAAQQDDIFGQPKVPPMIGVASRKPTTTHTGTRSMLPPFNPSQFSPYQANTTKYGGTLEKPQQQQKANVMPPKVSAGASTSFVFDNGTTGSLATTKTTTTTTTAPQAAAAPAMPETYTILRIKRKRNQEPLDTLVVQEQSQDVAGKKKQRKEGDMNSAANSSSENLSQETKAAAAAAAEFARFGFPQGLPHGSGTSSPVPSATTGNTFQTSKPTTAAVFRLATTVNEQSFKDPKQSIQLRDKITTQLAASAARDRSLSRPKSRVFTDRERASFQQHKHSGSTGSSSMLSHPPTEEKVSARRGKLVSEKQEANRTARYRVINQNRSGLSSPMPGGSGKSSPNNSSTARAPPIIKSSVVVAAEAALEMFNMYDAVREEDVEDAALKKAKKQQQLVAEAAKQEQEQQSDIMCNFLPMVREYLTISDDKNEAKDLKVEDDSMTTGRKPHVLDTPVEPLTAASRAAALGVAGGFDGDEDALGAGEDEDDDDEYVYDIYYKDLSATPHDFTSSLGGARNIGALLWFDEEEGNLLQEDDSSTDDYEDSDSNAEDYYQNDYPEDEVSDDDDFGASNMRYEVASSASSDDDSDFRDDSHRHREFYGDDDDYEDDDEEDMY